MFIPVGLIILFASFTQSVAGFGMGMVSITLLTVTLLPVNVAVPVVALILFVNRLLILWRYWHGAQLREIIWFTAASVVGVPFGVAVLRTVDESVVRSLLGVVVLSFVAYNTLRPSLPSMRAWFWQPGLGLIAGVLGAAYNVAGPPVVIYGTGRRWEPATFRANIQVFATVHSVFVLGAYAASELLTGDVWQLSLMALPFGLVGTVLGFVAARYIDAAVFRRIIMLLLTVTGVSLLL